uniref:Uncharacterized protein n=1 Tax=Moniliophthora roreri TaxID=221103 RepID=A0A0W0FEC3_MONRR
MEMTSARTIFQAEGFIDSAKGKNTEVSACNPFTEPAGICTKSIPPHVLDCLPALAR